MNKLEDSRIAIIGLGYVGLPLAVEFGKQFDTVGYDIHNARIAELKQGRDSTSGQLHNDTAYGIVDGGTVVSRTPLTSLKPGDIAITPKGKNIRDPQLQ